MGKLKEHLEEDLKDRVAEKLKEEAVSRIEETIDEVAAKIRSFLGLDRADKARLAELENEITGKKSRVPSDAMMNMAELCTSDLVRTFAVFWIDAATVSSKDDQKNLPHE